MKGTLILQFIYSTRYIYAFLILASFSFTSCLKEKNPVAPNTYSSVYLTQISVSRIPWNDPNGNPWDFSGWPDIQVDLLQNDRIQYATSTRLDITPDNLPVNFSVSPQRMLSNWDTEFVLEVWDEDPLGWELIGSVSFRVNSIIHSQGYVSSHTLQSGSLRTRITLRWE